jgi:hypothetical protein
MVQCFGAVWAYEECYFCAGEMEDVACDHAHGASADDEDAGLTHFNLETFGR